MKAMIMAGGEGARLRPLTCDCPKPMVPLMGKPVMEYALMLLKRHGIREVGVTLQYLHDRVTDHFGGGEAFQMDMRYYVEETPLGTAGSVKQAREFLDETFIVLSGDGLTDCDLTAAVARHKERGALATMVLKRVENPLEYGVVITETDGRVRRFVEKPTWGEVFSDLVNTGIYILEPEVLDMIPEGKPYDFGRELFPSMVKRGDPVYAYPMEGYWCDIGDIAAYLRAHADVMDGRVNLPIANKPGSATRMPGAQVDQSAIVEAPCYIGEGAVVREGARIGAHSVIGANCVIGRNASVKRAVLWPGARLHDRAQARGCILQRGATLGAEAAAFEECALGDGSTLGARAVMLPGVRVWPHKSVGEGVRLDANVVWGDAERERFCAGALAITSPSQAARTAQAYCTVAKPDSVLIGRAASAMALSYAHAVQAGLMAQGMQVIEAGATTAPQLRNALWETGAGGALLVEEHCIRPIDQSGADVSTDTQRKIEGALLRHDYQRPFSTTTKLPVKLGRTDLHYTAMCAGRFPRHTENAPQIAVYAPGEQLLGIAEQAFLRAGYAVRAEWEEEMMELRPGEIGVWLEPGEEAATLADEQGQLSESQTRLLAAWCALESGAQRLILPVSDTRAIESLAERYGARTVRVKGERSHLMRALLEEDRRQFLLRYDGIYFALHAIELLSEKGMTPRQWLADMPPVNRRSLTVPLDLSDKGRVLRALAEAERDADLTDGVSVMNEAGWILISPSTDRPELYIITEAFSNETAAELCDFYFEKVQRAVKGEG